MELHELVYVSLATRDMSGPDLTEMLAQARAKNAKLNITGLLVYHQREFMQLLEGNKADIFALYDTICRDARNQQSHLLWDGAIQRRSFAEWSMAFLATDNLSLEGNPAYSRFLEVGLSRHALESPNTPGKALLMTMRDDFLRGQGSDT